MGLRSKIDCYVIQQTGHSGSDNMCSLENVVLDMAPYSNKDLTKKTMEDYKKTKHEDQVTFKVLKSIADTAPAKTTKQTACSPRSAHWKSPTPRAGRCEG